MCLFTLYVIYFPVVNLINSSLFNDSISIDFLDFTIFLVLSLGCASRLKFCINSITKDSNDLYPPDLPKLKSIG